jgi:hypothetical protein
MYEERVLAFIDILGFSNTIKKTVDNGIEDEIFTRKINNLIENIQWHLNYEKNHFGENIIKSKIVNQFSDSIIISYLMNEESGIFDILLDILYLCAAVIQKGFLLRGAIVCDKLFHTENKIFGPALVKAYEMESKLAIYPRIILDDNIIKIAELYHNRIHDPEMEREYVKQLILKDFDGLYFINIFDAIESELDAGIEEMPEYFESLKKIIVSMDTQNNFSIKSKYLWLKEKYNIHLTKYKKNYNNTRAKNEYPELYEYYKNSNLL